MTLLRAILYTCHATLLVSAVLQPPKNIKLLSENFKHILTWEDPNNVSAVYYSVEYSHNHQKFVSTGNCSNITVRHCDLTKDFTDLRGRYAVLVKSFTNQSTSEGYLPTMFSPNSNTILGPPIVDVVPCDHCLRVSIQPPVSYLWSEEQQRNVTMLSDDVYPILDYTIQLKNSQTVVSIDVEFGRENNTIISNLLPRANYCVSVTVATAINLTPSIPSAPKCVITGPNHSNEHNTLLIVVSVVCAVILLVTLLLILFGLDRTGYIFKGKNYIPKVLKSIPASPSAFSGSNDFGWSTRIVPVEIMEKKIEVEDIKDKEKSCGEGYASRKPFLTKSVSGTGSGDQPPSATSSSEESSGPPSDSSEEDTSAQLSAGLDISSAVSEGSCSSSTPLPVNALNKTSSSLFSNSGVFDINLNSVAIADPEDAWTGLQGAPKAEPVVLMSPQLAGITLDTENCRDFPCDISIDELRMPRFEGGCSEEEEEDSNSNDGSDEHLSSGYMRR
ncbi:interferon alpha/beta receptor 2-like isoform X2 [Pseudophryne corroboree]|uniref:interferon alpha/beta receptor 2-like isoform X2 n=1 Tax=Pseudophryne corroboree TaxID=495146 RepID=UPI003081A82E